MEIAGVVAPLPRLLLLPAMSSLLTPKVPALTNTPPENVLAVLVRFHWPTPFLVRVPVPRPITLLITPGAVVAEPVSVRLLLVGEAVTAPEKVSVPLAPVPELSRMA